MLKYKADLRSLIFMLAAFVLLITLWVYGAQMPLWIWAVCYGLQLLAAVIISTIVHNHQHLPMWRSKWINTITDNILTVFYGFPIFAWVPTHNANHHVHVNKEPDYTKTYMASESNNLFRLLTYPTLSGIIQQKAVGKYLVGLYRKKNKNFYFHVLQIFSLITWVVVALVLDWQKALYYVIIPQQLSLFTVLIFNYIQHIHADEESDYNHSRNMTGGVLNFLLLNNGYHTAHHTYPGTHWSRLKEEHNKLAHNIDPRLNESNFGWYLLRVYLLGIFIPSCQTENMRLERMGKLVEA